MRSHADLDAILADETLHNEALSAARKPGVLSPINPIILVHGLFGFDTLFGIADYWKDIPEALRAAGAEVYVARVSATSAVETRAAELAYQIGKKISRSKCPPHWA
jgi:triacylglycerol esterase/lipase EstA (alpha/beta hydrolase family)